MFTFISFLGFNAKTDVVFYQHWTIRLNIWRSSHPVALIQGSRSRTWCLQFVLLVIFSLNLNPVNTSVCYSSITSFMSYSINSSCICLLTYCPWRVGTCVITGVILFSLIRRLCYPIVISCSVWWRHISCKLFSICFNIPSWRNLVPHNLWRVIASYWFSSNSDRWTHLIPDMVSIWWGWLIKISFLFVHNNTIDLHSLIPFKVESIGGSCPSRCFWRNVIFLWGKCITFDISWIFRFTIVDMVYSIVITGIILGIWDSISKAELLCNSLYTLHGSSYIILFFYLLRLIHLIFPHKFSRWLVVDLLIIMDSISSIRTAKSVSVVSTLIRLNGLGTVYIADLRLLIDMIYHNSLPPFLERSNIVLLVNNCGVFIF